MAIDTLDELLKEAVAIHEHLCSGQVLGVRMAMVGCREVGILEPGQKDVEVRGLREDGGYIPQH